MQKEDIIKQTAAIIRQNLAADYKIFLFGSQAKGNALETSDIDIGILGEKEVPWEAMVKIKAAVEGIPTLRQVDIVDLMAAGEELRNRVLANARELN